MWRKGNTWQVPHQSSENDFDIFDNQIHAHQTFDFSFNLVYLLFRLEQLAFTLFHRVTACKSNANTLQFPPHHAPPSMEMAIPFPTLYTSTRHAGPLR
jgi:hypothetical protein